MTAVYRLRLLDPPLLLRDEEPRELPDDRVPEELLDEDEPRLYDPLDRLEPELLEREGAL